MQHRNNFDSIRIIGALLVFFSHCFPIGIGIPDPRVLNQPLGTIGVFIFFTTSGYLISKSAVGSRNAKQYFKNRALRIYPGLIACVMVCTFIIGPYFTNLSLKSYFSSTQTWAYLQNASAIFLEAELPGTFEENKLRTVNGSLWTLPYELLFYFIFFCQRELPVRYRFVFPAVVLIFFATLRYTMEAMDFNAPIGIDRLLKLGIPFALGSLAFFLRAEQHPRLLLAISACGMISMALTPKGSTSDLAAMVTVATLLTLTAFHTPKISLLPKFMGDPSYGIYIYAFPVQQAFHTLLKPSNSTDFLYYIFTTLITLVVLSTASWHLIEKPALSFKGKM